MTTPPPKSPPPTAVPDLPSGLDTVIALAGTNADFGRALLQDPVGAAEAWGVKLRAQERAILKAVPLAQLEKTSAVVGNQLLERRCFLSHSVASAATLLGGIGLLGLETGCRCDHDLRLPRPRWREMQTDGGMSPSLPGQRPPPEAPCFYPVMPATFTTLSGPNRSPGEVDLERLKAQLDRGCSHFKGKPGRLIFEFTVEASGKVVAIKTLENTIQSPDLEALMKGDLEKITYFPAEESAVCQVVFQIGPTAR